MTTTDDKPGDGVIRLVTQPERDAADREEYDTEATAEAARMLEEVLAVVRDPSRRVTGVAIALTFADGGYASSVPKGADQLGALLGALSDAQYRLLRFTNGHDDGIA